MGRIYDLDAYEGLVRASDTIAIQTENGTKQVLVSDLFDYLGGNAAYLAKSLAQYNGKDLTNIYTPSEFQEQIESGDWTDINLGDWFDIELTTGEVMQYAISGFNTYLNHGDTALTANHVIMTPIDCMATTAQMNTSNTNTGGYASSLMPDYLEEVLATFPSEWQAVMRSIRRLENNKGAWAWASRTLFLLSETEVHGFPNWAYDGYDGGTRPLPLYQFSHRYRTKGLGYGASARGSRCSWWLASPSSAITTYFAYVSNVGNSSTNGASYSAGVAPGFCI